MTAEERKLLAYIVACISEFARATNQSMQEAFRYLDSHDGIDFLIEYYDVEHLAPTPTDTSEQIQHRRCVIDAYSVAILVNVASRDLRKAGLVGVCDYKSHSAALVHILTELLVGT